MQVSSSQILDYKNEIFSLIDHAKSISPENAKIEFLATPVFTAGESVIIEKINNTFIATVSIDVQVGSRSRKNSVLSDICTRRITETINIDGYTCIEKIRNHVFLWMKGEAQRLEDNLLCCYQKEMTENSTAARNKLLNERKKNKLPFLFSQKVHVSYKGKGDNNSHSVMYGRPSFGLNSNTTEHDLIQCSNRSMQVCKKWNIINDKNHHKHPTVIYRICRIIKIIWHRFSCMLKNLLRGQMKGFIVEENRNLHRGKFRFWENAITIKRTGVVVSKPIKSTTSQNVSLSHKKSVDLPRSAIFQYDYKPLNLKGGDGVVNCKVHGISKNILPTFSRGWRFEFRLRSYLRMKNLAAYRGMAEGTRMIGPLHYYGNLEKPDQNLYTIHIDDQQNPQIFQTRQDEISYSLKVETKALKKKKQSPDSFIKPVKAKWKSGTTLKKEKKGRVRGESLFPNAGILELETDNIQLDENDAREIDLSSFKARLVPNHIPFRINKKKLSPKNEYRAVSYEYESNYAKGQVSNGGGVFLETHPFAQTLTPLSPNNGGFVTLGRWDEKREKLELIKVRIPFNYTLIIEEGCIHGDAWFKGKFLMTMTSDHVTMSKADTVFLREKEGNNVTVS